MLLENVVFDAVNPQRLGKFWEAVVNGGPVLDLCFQQVPETPSDPVRLHLDLRGGAYQAEEVERLVGLGASHLDIGHSDVPWVVLEDPECNPCCVMEEREVYTQTGPIAALPLDCADPKASADFWSWLTGWTEAPGTVPQTLRHPSGRGPLLEMCPEVQTKGPWKNRVHLDVRLDATTRAG